MPSDSTRSVFERLKEQYDRTALECPACGSFDEGGEWETATDGASVTYRHECPSCGETQTKTLHRGD